MTYAFKDPYLEWSVQTDFKGHAAGVAGEEMLVPVLIRLKDKGRPADLNPGLVSIPNVYLKSGRSVCTGIAKRSDLAALEGQVETLEFSLPIPARKADTRSSKLDTYSNKSQGLVIGVIDRDCAFLNASFCWGTTGDQRYQTRIAGLWDQARPSTRDWHQPDGFGYGRELRSTDINPLLARVRAGESEESVYRSEDTLLNASGMVLERTHGTHVLDTAGGLPSLYPMQPSAKPTAVDDAAKASLVFVSVPGLAPGDTSGAAADVFILDAIQYILEIAGPTAPVVINISLGALAGPHDGTSLIETAIDDILSTRSNLLVALAAGNSSEERWHAFGELPAGNRQTPSDAARFTWRILPEDVTDSFVEIWFQSSRADSEGVEVQVTPPGGKPLGWTKLDDQQVLGTGDFPRAGMFLGRHRGVIGRDAMALLALAPTAGERDRAPHGLWTVELRNTSDVPVAFDAWVQRDEPILEGGEKPQSFFESSMGCTIRGDAAMNSLATGSNTIVVGASRLNDGSEARYSPRGTSQPGRRAIRDIDIFAAADESGSAYGLYAAAVHSGREVRMSGTSVSAPVAARHLANELMPPDGQFANLKGGVHGPQVRDALRPPAARGPGPHPRPDLERLKPGKRRSQD